MAGAHFLLGHPCISTHSVRTSSVLPAYAEGVLVISTHATLLPRQAAFSRLASCVESMYFPHVITAPSSSSSSSVTCVLVRFYDPSGCIQQQWTTCKLGAYRSNELHANTSVQGRLLRGKLLQLSHVALLCNIGEVSTFSAHAISSS